MTQSRCMSYNYYTLNMRQLSSTNTGPGGPGAVYSRLLSYPGLD